VISDTKECKRPAKLDFPIAEVPRHSARENKVQHNKNDKPKGEHV